jgi:hypothetical protein
LHYFDGNKELFQIEFRKLLAKELIYNKYMQQEAEDGLWRSKGSPQTWIMSS